MNKLLPVLIRVTLLFALLTAIPVGRVFAAGSLQLSPANNNAAQNTTFTLTLSINTDNNSVTGSDVTLQYDQAGLEYVSATNGSFFPNLIPANDGTAGQLVLHGYVTSMADAKTGTGTLATIVFKVKQSSNSSRISFVCSTSGIDTSIIASSGANVLSCASVNSVSVTYGAAPTSTPTPTPGPSTPTPTPPGSFAPVCTGISSDSQATRIPAAFNFSCSGTDQSGRIMAAAFDFGDGTTDTIYKNVGSPGTITTTHTYTGIGSFRATCKVQDNDNVWSQISGECTKIISIIQNPATTNVYRTVYAQNNTNRTITPTPTPPVVNLIYITPTATASPEISPLPIEKTSGGNSSFWWLLGSVGVILVGGIVYLLSKRGAHPPPPVPPPAPPITR